MTLTAPSLKRQEWFDINMTHTINCLQSQITGLEVHETCPENNGPYIFKVIFTEKQQNAKCSKI
jgi:hypothetical protein